MSDSDRASQPAPAPETGAEGYGLGSPSQVQPQPGQQAQPGQRAQPVEQARPQRPTEQRPTEQRSADVPPPSPFLRSTTSPEDDRFDSLAVERIIKRAMDIDSEGLILHPEGISSVALEQAAEELGVSPDHVSRALAEERLGLLESKRNRVDSLVGPSDVLASRRFEIGEQQALDAVEVWFTKALMFHKVSSGPGTASYVRRSDLLASIRRGTGSLRGAPDLSRVNRLDVRTSADGAGKCILVLEADVGIDRALTIAGGAGIAGVGSALAVVGATGSDFGAVSLVGVPLSMTASTLFMIIRARTLASVEVALDRVLELLASGTPPGNKLTGVAKRLMAGRRPG